MELRCDRSIEKVNQVQFGAPKMLSCCFLCQVWPPKRIYNMWTNCLEAHRNKNNILAANKKDEYHQPKVEIAPFIKYVQHLCSPGNVRESRRQICASNLWVTCLNFVNSVLSGFCNRIEGYFAEKCRYCGKLEILLPGELLDWGIVNFHGDVQNTVFFHHVLFK